MQSLARTIAKELETEDHCAVYESELERVWPEDDGNREKSVKKFAERHHWNLRFYKEGFVAIFVKEKGVLPSKSSW